MPARSKKPRAGKLSATQELRLKMAKHTGEWIGCTLALSQFTAPWWRWTTMLNVALILERSHALHQSKE